MTLRQLLSTVRKRWGYIVVLLVLTCTAVGVWSKLSEPVYTARASAYFSLNFGQTPGELYQGSNYTQQQIGSYALLATKPIVLDPVIRELGLDTTTDELARSIEAQASVDSVIVEIAASSTSRDRSAELANAVVERLGAVVRDLSPKLDDDPSVVVTAVAVATPPQYQSAPNTFRNLLIAGLAGLFLGLLAALAREHLDTRLRADEAVPRGVAVLGAVENDRAVGRQPLKISQRTGSQRQRIAYETFRRVRTNLRFLDLERPIKVMVVTSSVAGEGKSSVSLNLADALAAEGRRVVLVETDMRRPKLADYLGIEGAVGLVDVLAGTVDLDAALQRWARDQPFILPSGSIPPNPAELLGSEIMTRLVGELRSRFDLVLLDAPPLLPVADASVVASLADGAIVVVRHGRTTAQQFSRAVESLEAGRARVLGAVFNRVPPPKFWHRRGTYEYYSSKIHTAGD